MSSSSSGEGKKEMSPVASSADKKSYVVAGAVLSCSYGSQPSRLNMQMSHGVYVKGKPIMNVMDYIPNVNIMPFGSCGSMNNPAVAAATAAHGLPQRVPCMPMVTMPWLGGKTDKSIDNYPSLLHDSTNMCMYCGQIRVEDDGQNLNNSHLVEDNNSPTMQEEEQDWNKQLMRDITKNTFLGAVDATAGKYLFDAISDRKHYVTKAPAFGPAAEFKSVRFKRGTNLIKGASKFAGPAAAISTAFDVVEDFEKYEGDDRYYAAGLSVGGTVATGIVGAGVAALGAPVIAVVGAGVIAGVAIGAGVSYLKEELFGK